MLAGGRPALMSNPYSDDLRLRAVLAVESGLSRRQAAEDFSVGASSVIRWSELHRLTGSVSAKAMGGSRGSRIAGADREWLLTRIAAQPDLTLEEMRRELAEQRGLAVGYGTVWRVLGPEKQNAQKKTSVRPPTHPGCSCNSQLHPR